MKTKPTVWDVEVRAKDLLAQERTHDRFTEEWDDLHERQREFFRRRARLLLGRERNRGLDAFLNAPWRVIC